jgi:DNA-binding MarR family transcriptional regulator
LQDRSKNLVLTDRKACIYTHFVEPVETACVCTTLRMATRSVARLYDRALGEAGLRQAGYSILSRLDAEGPFTISDLADRLTLERTTCSREVGALVDAGLLTTEAGSDRRQRLVRLSDQGAEKLTAARAHWHSVQDQLAGAFGTAETEALLERLRTLLKASEELAGRS